MMLCELYNETLHLFREKAAIESAPKIQVISAINLMFFKELKNTTTKTITFNIP